MGWVNTGTLKQRILTAELEVEKKSAPDYNDENGLVRQKKNFC